MVSFFIEEFVDFDSSIASSYFSISKSARETGGTMARLSVLALFTFCFLFLGGVYADSFDETADAGSLPR